MLPKFNKIKNEQFEKAKEFEDTNSFEMAYLAYWIVIEKGLKIIEVERKRRQLYDSICAWKEFLEDSRKSRPPKISSFDLQEPEKVPDVKSVSKFLGGLPTVVEIMNTKSKNGSTKWRDRRNNIAHQAAPFASESKFFEYKNKIIHGIVEMQSVLEKIDTQ